MWSRERGEWEGKSCDKNFISISRKHGGQSHLNIKSTNRIAMR